MTLKWGLVLPGIIWSASAGGAVSKDIQSLPTRREVMFAVSDETAKTWPEIHEDSLLAAGAAPDLADVRVMNERGELVPVAVVPPRLVDVRRWPWLTLPPHWQAGESGQEEIIVDLGAGHPRLLRIQFPETGGAPVRVYRSSDRKSWEWVGESFPERPGRPHRGPSHPVTGRALDLRFVDRYVRLERQGPPAGAPDDSIRIVRFEENPSPREPIRFHVRNSGFFGRRWTSTLDVPGPPRTLCGVVVTVDAPSPASPRIEVEAWLEEGGWKRLSPVHQADWTAGPVDTLLFEPERTAAVRVSVPEADPPNPPFRISGLAAVPARWRIPAGLPDARLWIAYGDPLLLPRAWDLEATADNARDIRLARLGPPEANPFHTPPGFGLEWLRRRPAVLAGMMVVMLIGVAVIVLRRRPGQAGTES